MWRLWVIVLLGPVSVPAPTACVVAPVVVPYPVAALAPLATGAGVRVAVVDSGVDGALPQLAGGRDLLPGRPGCGGHGTAVAASIAGIAPGVRIVAVRVSDGDPGDAAGIGRVAEGIRWAAGPGRAQVINVSLVIGVDDRRVRAAVAQAVHGGVIVVAAAGNDPRRPVGYPAAYPGVIGVGAVLSSGATASFSPVGPEVDLVAVGDGGTSFSAAFVSGAAALLRQRFPDASAAWIAERLSVTADVSRRLNPYRALTEAGAVSRPPVAAAATPPISPRYDGDGARAWRRASWFAGVALILLVSGASAVAAHSRGRRRGWRPPG
ncbi:S8 family serine peptidase [Actinoplanes regularis]|uniref:S8 family serine peptidase n=1 Tax=Actinoplanes regularis TaxID=52697 RepID=UPI0015C6756C|nr:S8 family serine peptidase [Actinoplanes regularis]